MPLQAPLPEFENPPVSEVALSIEFTPLEGWRSPHSGLYWGSVRGDYPETEVKPPLPSEIEKFGDEYWHKPAVRIEFASPDINRFWFISEDKTRLIQIQRDRFIINWRKVKGDESYPRYQAVMRPRMEAEWSRFRKFIEASKLGEIAVQQCEVTYVNDIIEGEGWVQYSDTLKLFSSWWNKGTDGFLPLPEQLTVAGSFLLPDDKGRLHFVSQPAIRGLDKKKVVQIRLTARGKPASSSNNDILAWMDFGREWVVRAFSDLTSNEAHKVWKRKR